MRFELLPTLNNPGYWDVYDSDTGEMLDTCATCSEATYVILKKLHAYGDTLDSEDSE